MINCEYIITTLLTESIVLSVEVFKSICTFSVGLDMLLFQACLVFLALPLRLLIFSSILYFEH